MKKKTAILLAGTMIASTILAGCGSKEEGAANQVASEELKGDITFWHSFTQGPRLEVIQETADQAGLLLHHPRHPVSRHRGAGQGESGDHRQG